MNTKPVLKSILMLSFTSALVIGLSACDNRPDRTQTDASQSVPSSSTTDSGSAPAPAPAASTATPAANTSPAPQTTSTPTTPAKPTPTTPAKPTPTTPAKPTPTTPAKPTPTTTTGAAAASASSFPSGRGILWKPVSHGFAGRLVVLIPPSIARASTPILILDADGNTIDRAYYHNAHGENGGRHHFIFGRTGRAYPSPSILSIGGANYLIPNPGARYE